MNSSAVSFFQDLRRRISQVSREASYIFQRIAVTMHTTFQLHAISRRFRCLGRFRIVSIATPASDFNFFELSTLGIFTTEGDKT